MPGRGSTPSDPSLEPEDWQQIWRRLKNLCLVTQRNNSRLISVTARPDDIFGDAVTFARRKDDIYRRKRYLDIESFSSFVSISDVTHPASQSTELRIQWEACLLHLNQSESRDRTLELSSFSPRGLISCPFKNFKFAFDLKCRVR